MNKGQRLKVLSLMVAIAISPVCFGVVVIDDHFDDGDITTNTNGIGTGFANNVLGTGIFNESGTDAVFFGTTGGSRSLLTSNDTFSVNTGNLVTATFEVTDFGRANTANNNTSRYFVGFSDQTSGGPLEDTLDGLWVVLQGREVVGGAGNTINNGNGGLYFVDGTAITQLGLWTWDQSLVAWDSASTIRSDRIATCLLYTSPSPRDATLSRMPSSA